MLDVPAGRMLRYAGWSANSSAGLAIMGTAFPFLFYALESVRECKGDRAGHVLPRLL